MCGAMTDLRIDHDHACCPLGSDSSSCGRCVRGMLCHRCNVGIGFFRDNPDYLIAAAEYLAESGTSAPAEN